MQRAGIATYSLLCVVRLLCARSTYSIYFKAKYSAQHRAQSEAKHNVTYSIYFKAKYSAQHRAQSEAHGTHSHR